MLKRYLRSFELIALLAFATSSVSAANPVANASKRWVLKDEALVLVDPGGVIQEQIHLGTRENRAPNKDVSYSAHEVKAAISHDGTHALVHALDSKASHGVGSITRTASYYDSEGKLLWLRSSINRYWITATRNIVILEVRSPEDCGEEDGPQCSVKIISVDENGKDVLKLGPYSLISNIWLSENGRYGGIDASEGGRHRYIFFDVTKPAASLKLQALPGGVDIKDDGEIEFHLPHYGPLDKNGQAPILSVETVKRLRIN